MLCVFSCVDTVLDTRTAEMGTMWLFSQESLALGQAPNDAYSRSLVPQQSAQGGRGTKPTPKEVSKG